MIIPYGSFVSKCYLFNSDIDFCCWTPNIDIKEAFKQVTKILSENSDFQSVQGVDAEVPVVKCILNSIGCDISFSQPAGILTAHLLETLDKFIGKSHLFKRSLVLIQNYLLNESHILGSHNFMLSSYALRTMVAFVLLQTPQISSPLQTLMVFMNYFSQFDFENNVITVFGYMPLQDFRDFISPQHAVNAIQQQFLGFYKRESVVLKLVQNINLLTSLRVCCDDKYLKQKGYFDVGVNLLQKQGEIVDIIKKHANKISQLQHGIDFSEQLSINQQQQVVPLAIAKFIRSQDLSKFFKDEAAFQFKTINVADPLLPSNNLGKSVSVQNMFRLQRCIQLGQVQVNQLFESLSQGEAVVSQCIAEFDQIFVNTLAIVRAKGEQAYNVNEDQLFDGIVKVCSWGLGVKSQGVVWQC